MKILVYVLSFLLINNINAQQQKDCSCKQTLENLIAKVETEYPGFSDKTKDAPAYNRFKENLFREIKNTAANCPAILKSYTDFFKDPHLWVGINGVPVSGPVSSSMAAVNIDISNFKDKIKISKDRYEGIWSNENYTFGIKQTGTNEYTGFVITSKYSEWKPKDIKFKLLPGGRFEYALLDRTIKTGDYTLIDESILHLEDVEVSLVKEWPAPALSDSQVKEKMKELTGFYFKKLSDKTAVLKLPSFEYQHLQTIDSLITHHQSLLESENLIIDLRGNPGGTTDAYQKLLPYISGKFIRNTATEFLATQTYINNLEAYKKTLDKNAPTERIDSNIKKLKEHLGKFVNFNTSATPQVQLEPVAVAPKSPKNVIILANGLTGSSAEYFLFIAKQSKKVKIFGKPSYGALDYGNAYLVNLDCKGYQVLMPTYRALRLPHYPIDNIGIQPDIYMDNGINDWVAFALDYLEN